MQALFGCECPSLPSCLLVQHCMVLKGSSAAKILSRNVQCPAPSEVSTLHSPCQTFNANPAVMPGFTTALSCLRGGFAVTVFSRLPQQCYAVISPCSIGQIGLRFFFCIWLHLFCHGCVGDAIYISGDCNTIRPRDWGDSCEYQTYPP